MAPLPPNNTMRYFLDYTVCSRSHTLEMRVADGTNAAAASTAFDDLFTALDDAIFATTIDLMRVSDNGSDFSFPVTYSGSASFGSGTGTPADSGGYSSWIGRSIDGRRAHVTVFGSKITATGGNWRAAPGENTDLDNALGVLVAATDLWLSISGLEVVWNNYTNNGYNAYWRNHTR